VGRNGIGTLVLQNVVEWINWKKRWPGGSMKLNIAQTPSMTKVPLEMPDSAFEIVVKV